MEQSYHPMSELFTQLGLPASSDDIEKFIKSHRLKADEPFVEAKIWNDSQKNFLSQALEQDSDWAEVVDQLNVRLRD